MINKGEIYTLVANKQTGEVNVYSAFPLDKENEIQLNAYMQHSGFDGHVVMNVMPLALIDKKFSNQNSVGYKLSQELEEDDNPISFVYEERARSEAIEINLYLCI